MPRVSIIVVNYNRRDLLLKCLQGVSRQTHNEIETIVVDNGSGDGSQAAVMDEHPDCHLVEVGRNSGFAAGCNLGIALARGEYIALLNNDAVPAEDWVEVLVRAGERYPKVSSFASRVLSYDHPGLLDSAGDSIAATGAAYRRGHGHPAAAYDREEEVFGASGCAAFYRRSMLEDVGPFDEDFFLVYEDVDLSFRAQLRGHTCLFVPQAIVYHIGSHTIGAASQASVYYTRRNVELFFFKDMPGPLLCLLLPGHIAYEMLACGYYALTRFGLRHALRGKRDAMRAASRTCAKRREIQSSRTQSWRRVASFIQVWWLGRVVGERLAAMKMHRAEV